MSPYYYVLSVYMENRLLLLIARQARVQHDSEGNDSHARCAAEQRHPETASGVFPEVHRVISGKPSNLRDSA